MKLFIVLSAVLALTVGFPVEMTLQQIDQALTSKDTPASLIPTLENALNKIMAAIFAGEDVETVTVDLPLTSVNLAPAVVDSVPPFSSPLVQVVVNVNKKTSQGTETTDLSPAEIIEPEINPIDIISVNPAVRP